MKRLILVLSALALTVSAVGCASRCDECRRIGRACRHQQGCGPQCGPQCGPGGGCLSGFGHGGGAGLHGQYNPGPASATVAYPYYTTRGPRDFLAANPRGIGP